MRYILAACTLLAGGALSTFAAVDPALLALIPGGVKLVSGVQLDQARNSEFGRYMLNRIDAEDESFQQFTEQTGFDPRRDLDEFVFATTGQSADHNEPIFVIAARGTFDRTLMEQKAKAKGAALQSYQGVDLITHNEKDHRSIGVAFLDGGIAVMSDPATLRQIVANRTTPTALDPVLEDQVLKVSANNDAWFASSMSGSFLTRHLEHEADRPIHNSQALQSILQSSGGVHFGDVVEFSFDAITRSPQDAVSLADLFRLGGSMVQMQRQADPRAGIIASAIDKMTISNDGPNLHATFGLTEKNLEQLVGDVAVATRTNATPTKPSPR